jgi:hypothetical protein
VPGSAALYGGITGETWVEPGVGLADIAAKQATFYDRRES